ncbi:MAG: JAB domain-containing protein [Ferruginibacter sp.]|nr:JAB domain-containing protein [Ferruginibacter sp.]
MHFTSIKNWSVDDRPREKMKQLGASSLSNVDLIAILLRSGNRSKSAVDLAREILNESNNNLDELGKFSIRELEKIKGIGPTKAITIMAALELGRRRHAGEARKKTSVTCSKDVAEYLRVVLKDYTQEVFGVLYLNRANKINHFEIVSKGGITGTVADPRIILKRALEEDATSIVLSHNHPSGNLNPSKADHDLTHKIREAAALMDIKLLDHIIVSDEGYYSFMDEGDL